MGDEGFDPCECMWSHELGMRRLLSLLRQSQAYCTDTECLEDVQPQMSSAGDNSFVMMMMCWMVIALVLYLLRPNSMRNSGVSNTKDTNNGSPPDPPATVQ